MACTGDLFRMLKDLSKETTASCVCLKAHAMTRTTYTTEITCSGCTSDVAVGAFFAYCDPCGYKLCDFCEKHLIRSDAELDERLKKATLPVVIDCFTQWSPKCRKASSIFVRVARELAAHVLALRVDCDLCKGGGRYGTLGVDGFPTYVGLHRSTEAVTTRHFGVVSEMETVLRDLFDRTRRDVKDAPPATVADILTLLDNSFLAKTNSLAATPLSAEEVAKMREQFDQMMSDLMKQLEVVNGIEVPREEAIRFANTVGIIERYEAHLQEMMGFAVRLSKVFTDLPEVRKRHIQLAFCLDGTWSMQPYIDAVRTCIIKVISDIKAIVPLQIDVGAVVYRDYLDEKQYEVYQFMSVNDFCATMEFIQEEGGGDIAEDCFGGLYHVATDLKWNPDDIHVCLWCGDGPAHGFVPQRKRAPGCDRFPDGDPAYPVPKVVTALLQAAISVAFIKIDDITDLTLREFDRCYTSLGGQSVKQIRFNDAHLDEVIKELIIYTASDQVREGNGALVEVKRRHVPSENLGDVIFSKMDAVLSGTKFFRKEAVVTSSLWESILAARTAEEVGLERTAGSLSVAEPYFAAGGIRYAHRACTATTAKLVAKDFQASENSLAMHIAEYRGHQLATCMAYVFCRELRIDPHTFEYVTVELFEAASAPPQLSTVYSVELFVDGKFKKFNSNAGFVDESHPMANAFSHFSYVYSRGACMVVDVQGWMLGPEHYLLTDPGVQTPDRETLPTPTNLGMKGITQFLKVHRCNKFCEKLRLVRYDGGLPSER